jgi:hypothetical protein
MWIATLIVTPLAIRTKRLLSMRKGRLLHQKTPKTLPLLRKRKKPSASPVNSPVLLDSEEHKNSWMYESKSTGPPPVEDATRSFLKKPLSSLR